MRFLITLGKILVGLAVLLAVLVGLLFVPTVQTWIAQAIVARDPDLHLTFDQVAIRPHSVEIDNARWEISQSVFTVPHASFRLSVFNVWKTKQLLIDSCTVKGWTWDFTPPVPKPNDADESTTAENPAPQPTSAPDLPKPRDIFAAALRGVRLPCALAIDAGEIEGEIIYPHGGWIDPARLHVTAKINNFNVGGDAHAHVEYEAKLLLFRAPDIRGTADITFQRSSLTTIDRASVLLTALGADAILPDQSALQVDAPLNASARDREFRLTWLQRGAPIVATKFLPTDDQRAIAGTWSFRADADFARRYFPNNFMTVQNAAGAGQFSCALDGSDASASGHLDGEAQSQSRDDSSRALGPLRVSSDFATQKHGDSCTVTNLSLTLNGDRVALSAHSLQPVSYRIDAGAFAGAAAGPALEISAHDVPLAWLRSFIPNSAIDGLLTGDGQIDAVNGGFVLRTTHRVTATAVEWRSDSFHFPAMNVSGLLRALWQPPIAQLELSDAKISNARGEIGDFKFQFSRGAAADPITLSTTWSGRTAPLVDEPGFRWLQFTPFDYSRGELTFSVGDNVSVQGSATFSDHGGASETAKIDVTAASAHALQFSVPIDIALGGATQQITAEGDWSEDHGRSLLALRLNASELDEKHFRYALAPIYAALQKTSEAADKSAPFWAATDGQLYVGCDHFIGNLGELKNFRANIEIGPAALRLENCQFEKNAHQIGGAQGGLTFDAKALAPYHLHLAFDDGELDATSLFPAKGDADPVFHGRFTVTSEVDGQGGTLTDLMSHTVEKFTLKSTTGIVRFLGTDLIGVTHEHETKVGNAAAGVGSFIGKIAGIRDQPGHDEAAHLSKQTEGVLNFSYDVAEIGYNELTIEASRALNGPIQITRLFMQSPDFRVEGHGEISAQDGVSIMAAPLNVELRISTHGHESALLARADLLTKEKDAAGFRMFKQPVHFGGTLQQVDGHEWHDLLFAAAAAGVEPAKK